LEGCPEGSPEGCPEGLLDGIEMQHPSNASLATVVTLAFSTSGVEKNPVHWEKAEAPTLVTELGIKRSPLRPVHW